MARRNRYQINYARLERLLGQPPGDLSYGRSYRLRSDHGFMDLVVERLPPCDETGATVLSLAHYFEQNGDLCQDPEMVVRVIDPYGATGKARYGVVEALLFEQAIPPVYLEVHPEHSYCPDLARDLDIFLHGWLRNLVAQGHRLIDDAD